MKIKPEYGEVFEVESFRSFAEHALDGSDYGQGHLEDMQYTIRNICRSFGTLLDVLSNEGKITSQQALDILDNYKGYKLQ